MNYYSVIFAKLTNLGQFVTLYSINNQVKKIIIALFFAFTDVLGQSPSIRLTEVADGFTTIVDIEHAGDDRLFIVDNLKIKIFINGQTLVTPFLDFTGRAEWIMAVCFHPNYSSNGYFYLKYKDLGANCVISRFQVEASNPNLANLSSEQVLLSYPDWGGHEGGDMDFGKDGYLYTTTGDGARGARGDIGDEFGYAQNMSSVKGKMIRIDVNSTTQNYTIPPSNPYQNPNDGIPDEIIAAGLRNPWKWSFDRQTGDLWIGDVGQDDYEEVSFAAFGTFENRNYGWSCYEGNMPHIVQNCNAGAISYTMPIIEYAGYNNNGNLPASVTGGYVYRGSSIPALNGYYVYADYNSGRFWTLKINPNGSLTNEEKGVLLGFVTTFGEDKDGELYVATFNKFFKITVPCVANLNVDYSITSNQSLAASNSIVANNAISNNSKVVFQAGKFIELNPGFKVDNGSVFRTNIGNCSN